MSGCLSDQALLKLMAEDDRTDRHAHLRCCARCMARYQRLTRNLRAIEHILVTTAPPTPPAADRPRALVAWMPAVVALTATLLVAWIGWRRPPVFVSPLPPSAAQADMTYQILANDIAPALFAATDVRSPVLPTPASSISYLQAALDGGWPCEYRALFAATSCEPLALALASAQD
jgi:hypothetical protein